MKNLYLHFAVFCILLLITSKQNIFAQCLCSGGTAPATISHTAILNTTNASSSTITFPQFDPANGTLLCILLQDTISGITTTVIQNTGSNSTSFEDSLVVVNTIGGPHCSINQLFSKTYGPTTLGANNSITYGPDSLFKNAMDSSYATDTTGYNGKGTVNFIYTLGGGLISLTGGVNYNDQILTDYWGRFRLTYYYCQSANNQCHSFTATKSPGNVNLQWQCSNEHGNVNYQIQCSKNSYQFSTIGNTPCAAEGSNNVTYQYKCPIDQTDKDKLCFRIKRIDSAGNVSYCPTRVVNLDVQGIEGCNIYPNPARNNTVVEFDQMLTGNFSVELVNGSGSCVQRGNVTLSNSNQMKLNVSGLKKGLYMVFIKDPAHGQQVCAKLVVQ